MAKYGKKAAEKVESAMRERQTALRALRQEGDQPEAGNRHRPLRSTTFWGEGAAEEVMTQ